MTTQQGSHANQLPSGQALQVERIEPIQPLSKDAPIWTRQPGETDTEWAWFQLYRNMHPARRSVRGAYVKYREARGDTWEISHAPRQLEMMQRRWSWQKRAAEYDIYIDRERNIALLEAREDAIRGTAELGKNMRRAAAIAVDALFSDLYEEQLDPETGQKKIVFKEKLTPGAIVRLAKTGVELERLALGLDLGIGRGQPGPAPVNVNVIQGVGVMTPNGIQNTDDALLVEAAEILRMRELQSQVVDGEFEEQPPRKLQSSSRSASRKGNGRDG